MSIQRGFLVDVIAADDLVYRGAAGVVCGVDLLGGSQQHRDLDRGELLLEFLQECRCFLRKVGAFVHRVSPAATVTPDVLNALCDFNANADMESNSTDICVLWERKIVEVARCLNGKMG